MMLYKPPIIEKAISGKKVAVLHDPESGYGWSSAADSRFREFLLFDHTLVSMAELGEPVEKVCRYIKEKTGGEHVIRQSGWWAVVPKYIPIKTRFVIGTQNGKEFIQELKKIDWIVA